MSKIGKELIQAAKEASAIAKGEAAAPRAYVPGTVDVAAIRKRLNLTQADFAASFGVSLATLRDWEQGRRSPEGPARVLLTVIDREPEAVKRAVAMAS